MRLVSAYRRADAFYLQASSKTTVGVWVASGQVEVISCAVSDIELGTVVARRLEHSLPRVPHTTDWKSVFAPMLKASKTRSYSAFTRGAQLVSIEEQDGPVTITPMKQCGPRSGFEGIPGREVTVASTDLEHLGSVVRELLALAT